MTISDAHIKAREEAKNVKVALAKITTAQEEMQKTRNRKSVKLCGERSEEVVAWMATGTGSEKNFER